MHERLLMATTDPSRSMPAAMSVLDAYSTTSSTSLHYIYPDFSYYHTEYCDASVGLCVSVCVQRYLKNLPSELYQIFYACYLQLQLGPSLVAL